MPRLTLVGSHNIIMGRQVRQRGKEVNRNGCLQRAEPVNDAVWHVGIMFTRVSNSCWSCYDTHSALLLSMLCLCLQLLCAQMAMVAGLALGYWVQHDQVSASLDQHCSSTLQGRHAEAAAQRRDTCDYIDRMQIQHAC